VSSEVTLVSGVLVLSDTLLQEREKDINSVDVVCGRLLNGKNFLDAGTFIFNYAINECETEEGKFFITLNLVNN
jgi:hypothetical protein